MNEQIAQADVVESAVAAPAKKPAAKKKRGRPAAKKKAAKKPAAKKAKAKKPAKKKAAKKAAPKKAKAKKAAKKKAPKKAKKAKAKKPNDGVVTGRKGSVAATSSQLENASSSIKKSLSSFGAAFNGYAQEQYQDAVATAQQLLNCRTLEDMATLQSQFVQTSFDRLIKQANKLTQSAANAAKEKSGSMNNQLEQFVQRFYRAA
jgi:uncharacterized protein YukE